MAVVDAGYFSEENIKGADPDGPELVIAPTSDRRLARKLAEEGPPRERPPGGSVPRK